MTKIKNRGWTVTLAGLGINLALGILYTWSIFKQEIKESILSKNGQFTWDIASLNDPYAVCCLVFAFTMIFAGRLQDKIGPRLTAIIGGLLTGLGLILISYSNALLAWIIGFGILTGMGLGFGYAAATPPALKWFPPSKTGMIAGIVVAGFGLASVYIAPLSTYLISKFGLNQSMFIFGVAFIMVVGLLSTFLVNPPKDYKPVDEKQIASAKPKAVLEIGPMEMLKNLYFYKLWFMYFVGAGAGLMIISSIAGMAKQSLHDMAWIVVALMAVGNAGGRITAGIVSDKIGRSQTLLIILGFQAVIIFSLMFINPNSAFLLVAAATIIGFNYGTNLSLFPSVTKDMFGLKNFGVNYGLIFTAWGVGGFILPRISQMFVAATGSANGSYIFASILLTISATMAFFDKYRK